MCSSTFNTETCNLLTGVFAVKTVSPDHALMLQCVLFCLQVLHTNLESSLQVEDSEHELLQQMANSIKKKKINYQ